MIQTQTTGTLSFPSDIRLRSRRLGQETVYVAVKEAGARHHTVAITFVTGQVEGEKKHYGISYLGRVLTSYLESLPVYWSMYGSQGWYRRLARVHWAKSREEDDMTEKEKRGFDGERSWLSNFHECSGVKVPWDRRKSPRMVRVPTVEHGYIVAKVGTMEEFLDRVIDPESPNGALSTFLAMTPGQAKRLGRKVPLREDWEERKLAVMEFLLRQKFSIEPLRSWLAAEQGEIVEWNHWHDSWWGECVCGECPVPGKNHLGKLLMKIRGELGG